MSEKRVVTATVTIVYEVNGDSPESLVWKVKNALERSFNHGDMGAQRDGDAMIDFWNVEVTSKGSSA